MMQLNELRTGNLILSNTGIVILFDMEAFIPSGEGEKDCAFNQQKYRPIPLTEEWLIRFGFEKDDDGFYIFEAGRRGFIISPKEDNHVVYRHDIGLDYMAIHNGVEYVHQLQNLYYAITGEELSINL